MKTLLKAVAFLTFALGLALPSFAQTALNQTTLSVAVNGPDYYNGTTTGKMDLAVTLASVTNVNAPIQSNPVSFIYVGGEEMAVMGVNTTSKVVNVVRGFGGTKASPHPSGDMVLVSIPVNVTLASGNNPTPNGFYPFDPPMNATCTAAGTAATPWLNVLTAAQWLCSSITKTWVPGWNNPLATDFSKVTAAVASVAGATTISGPLFHITGTNAITSFTIPVGFNATASGGGTFCVIPDAAFTTTATNNIAKATTAVANQTVCFTWDATNSKFTASY